MKFFWGKRNVLGPIIMWKCLDWFCFSPREAISAVVCSLASSSDETVSTATAFPLSLLQQLHHSCFFFFFLWDFIWRTTSVASSFWLKLKGRWRTGAFRRRISESPLNRPNRVNLCTKNARSKGKGKEVKGHKSKGRKTTLKFDAASLFK